MLRLVQSRLLLDSSDGLDGALFKHLRPEHIVLAAHILFPEVKLIEGCAIRVAAIADDLAKSRLEQALRGRVDSVKIIEESFNSLEIIELFANAHTYSLEERSMIAGVIGVAWDAWLRAQFPKLNFKVQVVGSDEWEDLGVTFYQVDKQD